MSRTVRTNLGPKLLSGQIKGRPGMYGADRPMREPVLPGPMASSAAVERVAELTHAGMDFYAAFRQVMRELEVAP